VQETRTVATPREDKSHGITTSVQECT